MLGAKAICELDFDWLNRLMEFKNSLLRASRTTKEVDRRPVKGKLLVLISSCAVEALSFDDTFFVFQGSQWEKICISNESKSTVAGKTETRKTPSLEKHRPIEPLRRMPRLQSNLAQLMLYLTSELVRSSERIEPLEV